MKMSPRRPRLLRLPAQRTVYLAEDTAAAPEGDSPQSEVEKPEGGACAAPLDAIEDSTVTTVSKLCLNVV